MNNDSFFRIAAEQHIGYIKAAVQAREQRVKDNAPTLRDQVRHLANCCGAYLVGSSTRGCYKFGYGASLRNGIGSHVYQFELDIVMWRETGEGDEGKKLAEQLRDLFQKKSCKVKDTSGEWFKLDEANLEALRTEFGFQKFALALPNRKETVNFKLENFRPFQGGFVTCWDGSNGAVLIKQTGEVIYGRLKDEKKHLLSRYEAGDTLLLAWHGQWRTDVFVVSPADFSEPEEPTDLQAAASVV
jgi:hypothetical protein